jgi:3-phosphoshikimate 1-carboxyvinyltransferase
MRVRVRSGPALSGTVTVPGDKSIAHRWLLLAATADGVSRLEGLPRSKDVLSTVANLARLAPAGRPALEAWASRPAGADERHGSTWNRQASTLDLDALDLEGEGRGGLRPADGPLDCGNSGTTMRLLAGVVASSPFETVLVGDASLSSRPMERVAAPLRAMGAKVTTTGGRPPVAIRGARLTGITSRPDVPSAQVKGAVLLAGLAARATTEVVETVRTRDHTERLLAALGAPIQVSGAHVRLEGPFQHGGFRGQLPGDASSAAFLLAAAALTGGEVTVGAVGVNPSRLHVLDVLRRMGVEVEVEVEGEVMGEQFGSLRVAGTRTIRAARVGPGELPLVVDEIPMLALLATAADGESRFEGAAELRVKESDRIAALVDGIRGLGGAAHDDGDDLVIGGGGLPGGTARAAADHRIAMALTVGGLAGRSVSDIEGLEAAAVSFPGFLEVLRSLGADLEEVG